MLKIDFETQNFVILSKVVHNINLVKSDDDII